MIHMTKPHFVRLILITLFYYLLPCTNNAQFVYRLRNDDIVIKGLKKPLKLLPDSVKTYQLITQIEADPSMTFIDKDAVNNVMGFEYFKKKTADADMILSVTVQKTIVTSRLQSRKISVGSDTSVYWYEERFQPQVNVVLTNKAGQILFEKRGGLEWVYQTNETKTKAAAESAFFNRYKQVFSVGMSQKSYQQKIADTHLQTLEAWANNVKNTYDYRSEVVSLYFSKADAKQKNKNTEFMKHIEAIKGPLSMIGLKTPQAESFKALKQSIDFFEKQIADKKANPKGDMHPYYASALNLVNIYRCLEDFDKAQFYIRLLMSENYLHSLTHIRHIAEMKERFDAYTYFRKNGMTEFEAQQQKAVERFKGLKKQYSSVGYIILERGNRRVDGTLLNVLENFEDNKVKLKYEEKIGNSGNFECSLIDVKEIHFDDWHLQIVPYKTFLSTPKIYLMEIVYQSAQIKLLTTLPNMGIYYSDTKQLQYTELLQKTDDNEFYDLDNAAFRTFDGQLYRYLKDCPTIAQQARYGYYTRNQLPQALMDYDNTCGRTKNKKEIAANNTKDVKGLRNFISRGTGYNFGISMGSNNFTSLFGLSSNIRLRDKLFTRLGIGWGIWGTKFAAGVKYDMRRDMRYSNGWSFAAGYSHSNGFKQALNVGYGSSMTVGSTTTTKDVNADIRTSPVDALNLSMIYNKYLGRKKSIFLEFGYAFAFQKEPWTILTPNVKPSKELTNAIKLWQPGGFVLGLGLNFGMK
jgi:hypothetical protein